MNVAFLGLGIMGSRMAANCLTAGHTLTVWNRDPRKADPLVAAGARVVDHPNEAVATADVVLTMLAHPEAVQAVAFGEHGFAKRLTHQHLWVDCSTIDPGYANTLHQRAAQAGYRFLDAPVAGTKGPAEAGALLFLVGGTAEDATQAQPLFDAMGKKTLHLGSKGHGAAMKMLVNGLLAQSMLAFAEVAHLGTALGLAQQTVFDVLLATPVTAPFLAAIRDKTEGEDYSVNFPLKHIQKDLHLATLAGYETGRPLPSLNAAKAAYALACAQGLGDEDFSAIFRHLR